MKKTDGKIEALGNTYANRINIIRTEKKSKQ
jgi:hypothetical protein